MTFDDIKKIAFELPEVKEYTVFGGPTLRVGKRFLVSIAKIDPDTLCIKVPDSFLRDELLSSKPEIYYMQDHYKSFECLLVRMSVADPDEIRYLLKQAWLTYAPKKLVKEYADA